MGDINPVNPGDFYLLDADNPKRVIEIKENIATVYQNGIPTDEKYNVMSNEYQEMMINQLNNIANPVMLSRDEFVGKDKLKIINEKANGLMLDNVLDKFANKAEHSKKELIEQFNNPDFKFTGTAKDAVEFMEKHKISRHQMNNSMLTELQNIKARCNRRERNMQSVEL